jgi:PAS domain S-box-containing protein
MTAIRRLPHARALLIPAIPLALAAGSILGGRPVQMRPDAAAAFALIGVALLLLPHADQRRARVAVQSLAGLAVALGLATVTAYLLGRNVGGAGGPAAPVRMLPMSAAGFVLLGGALILVAGRRRLAVARVLNASVTFVSLLAVIERIYDIDTPRGLAAHTTITLDSALAFLACSVGLLQASPPPRALAVLSRDSAGGPVARRLLLAGVLVPLTLGWLRVLGERAGWYDAGFGTALFAMLTILLFSAIVWRNAVSLQARTDEQRRAEGHFLATFEQAAVGIAHVSPDGRWIQVNRKFCDIVGYTRDALVQMNFRDLTHPDDLDNDVEQLDAMLAGKVDTYSREKRYVGKGGRIVWTTLTSSLVRTEAGSPDYFISVVEDITRRKQAEQALHETEQRLRALYEANLIGIVVGRLGGGLLDANPAFCQLIGYTREELLAPDVTWRTLTPVEYHASDERALARLRAAGVVPPREKEYVRKDGTRVPVLVGVSTVPGSPDTSIAFVLDLTERRTLEDQLRQSQRLEVIGRLAGGVAHDFNNLLTPILGYAEMLLERFPSGPQRSDVLEIQNAGRRAQVLTRQLLAFSRRQVLQPTIVDLNNLISDAARLLRRLIGEDVTLVLALAPNLGAVKVDVGQMEQVLMNLAVNARDAMPHGGTLTIETANVNFGPDYVVRHTAVVPGRHVLLAVHDTGSGMDRETMSRIFEPFFTTKPVGHGTGLGLATVHGIVNQSNGHIWVYSEPGHGTTFKLYFPVTEGRPAEAAAPAAVLPVERGDETVLLVEDDDALREMSARALRALGYTVLEARDGATALLASKHHEGPIDLLLTDVVMPGMSGGDLAQQLLAGRPGLEVLYMSGYTDNAVVQHGVLEQGIQLLEKPFTPSALGRRVRAVLDAGRRGR